MKAPKTPTPQTPKIQILNAQERAATNKLLSLIADSSGSSEGSYLRDAAHAYNMLVAAAVHRHLAAATPLPQRLQN